MKSLWKVSLGVAVLSTLLAAASLASPAAQPSGEIYQLADIWTITDLPGEFIRPAGVAVDSSSDVYVVDGGNHRVQKFTSDGRFISTWGQQGQGPGEFDGPQDIAVDEAGRVYVTDTGNHRIQVFTPEGAFLSQWGETGDGPGQFREPYGLAVGTDGHVFVTDHARDRVLIFTSDGTYLAEWGTTGDGAGQFHGPRGVDVDGEGNVYVVDSGNHRVQKFTPDGRFLLLWGSRGLSPGQFLDPIDVAVSRTDPWVYVVESDRVQRFSRRGRLEHPWPTWYGWEGIAGVAFDSIQRYVYLTFDLTAWRGAVLKAPHIGPPGVKSWGKGHDRLDLREVTVGGDGDVYVVNDRAGLIYRFSPVGTLIWSRYCWEANDIVVDRRGYIYALSFYNLTLLDSHCGPVWTRGEQGSDPGQFNVALGLAQDEEGHLYVADTLNHRIQVFDAEGHFMAEWGGIGSEPGQFRWPVDVAHGGGYVYVADTGNARIQQFASDGTFVRQWFTSPGDVPRSLAADPAGNVYVLFGSDRVQKFTSGGVLVTQWGRRGGGDGEFLGARGIAVDGSGVVYVCDSGNARVQVFEPVMIPVTPTLTATPTPTAISTPAPTTPTPTPTSAATLLPTPVPCTVEPDKWAAPDRVGVGERVQITLTLDGTCPEGRPIADVMLVMDRSHSMTGQKIAHAKAAAQTFVEIMDLTQNQVGLVSFSSEARLDHPLTHDGAAVVAAIESLVAGGATAIDAGIRVAQQELVGQRHNPQARPVMILLTDGQNSGGPLPVILAALDAQWAGTRLFTIGLGEDADHELLQGIVSSPDDYFFAPSSADLADIYSQIAQVIQREVIATEVTILDTLSPNVAFVPGSGSPQPAVEGGLLRWRFAALPTTGITMTYQIEPQVPGRYPANTEARADFADSNGNPGAVSFPNPWITVRGPTETPTSTPTATGMPTPTSTASPTATTTPTGTPTPQPTARWYEAYLPTVLKHLCSPSRPSDANTLILTGDGPVTATILSSEAECPGFFSLVSPIPRVIFPDYQAVGGRGEVGVFTCGTELVFSITPGSFCSREPRLSTDPRWCRVTQVGPSSWILGWEDWVDMDYNDTVILIELERAEASGGSPRP